MKVIGIVPCRYRSGRDRLIVEMSSDEFSMACGKQDIRPEVGTTLDVAKIFKRLVGLNHNQARLNEVRQQLIAVAGLIEPLEGVVGCDAPAEGQDQA